MKRYLCAAALAVVASLSLAATASADVPRYQIQTATFTVTEPAGAVDQWTNVWTHSYTVTLDNPCGVNSTGAFTGTAPAQTGPGGVTEGTGETITGTFNSDGTISFVATRTYDGRTWTLTNAPYNTVVLAATSPSVSWDIDMKVSTPVYKTSSFKNHGDYVKQMGGGSDAAHSCIGMPIQNVAMTFTALVPEGAANQWVNVWTHTYSINYDAVTHTFSGTGTTVGTLGGLTNTEEITGLYDGPTITFDAHYLTGPYSLDGVSDPQFDYKWHYSGPFDTVGWATSNYQWSPGVFQTLEVKVTEPVAVP